MKMTDASHTYFARLIPQGKFFFGNERTFGQGSNVNYLIRSNPFPQQTTLLGMLRYELLRQGNKLLPITAENSKQVAETIGTEGFHHERMGTADFGYITELSPVFFIENSKAFRAAPLDLASKDKPNEAVQISYSSGAGQAFLFSEQSNDGFVLKILPPPQLANFDYKSKATPLLVPLNGAGSCRFQSEFLISDARTGNQKTLRGEIPKLPGGNTTKNRALFRQYFYQFVQPNQGFGFWFRTHQKINLAPAIVTLGAERSAFRLEIKTADWTDYSQYRQLDLSESIQKIVLLSDTFVSEKIYDHCTYAFAETGDFRHMSQAIHTDSHRYKTAFQRKSHRLSVLVRGSVLYPKSEKENLIQLKELLDQPALQQIGMNHYRIEP
ncbi:type III-B CRISPR module-associated Cmr3 family protein [Larkinella sp. VNQ87]|uniref:type III-B CRISPR module-associated Cmr3 family protein n=1 Tax=Larkinella sp. VNQ87 TaxID=3400921 RepID=UPI003C0FEC61